jgi:nuclear pore complex protein Nup98-Nup96
LYGQSTKYFSVSDIETASTSQASAQELAATSQTNELEKNANDSMFASRSHLDDTQPEANLIEDYPPHPTGITLHRSGYYTIPSLDELIRFMDEKGECIVDNFTIGRRGYGSVYFDDSFNVAGLNLDELVHFRHKEVTIYPDDENKPPVNCGLNRKAQVTLDKVSVFNFSLTLIQTLKIINF